MFNVCDENVNEVGERLATGAVPVPDTLMVWVEGLALSVTVMMPVREPVAMGTKATLIVQDAFAARLVPQVLVSEKSPPAAMLEIARVALPGLLSVTLCGLLLVPNACEANVKEVAESLAAGALPVPERLTV